MTGWMRIICARICAIISVSSAFSAACTAITERACTRDLAAPAALSTYAIIGWFYGMQETRIPLVLQVGINVVNILLDLLFVFGFGWGVEGVAAASLIASVPSSWRISNLLVTSIPSAKIESLSTTAAAVPHVAQPVRHLLVRLLERVLQVACDVAALLVDKRRGYR